MSTPTNILVLGPEGSGKSLLIKRLQYLAMNGLDAEFEEVPSTVPTVGNDILQLNINSKEVTLREVGGAMAPIWKNYYKHADALIYIVDKSNQFQLSAACIMLLTMLSHETVKGKNVLLLFNKTDFTCSMSLLQLEQIFRLNDLRRTFGGVIRVAESSSLSSDGYESILEWLQDLT